jgi:hypothetical protein
MSFLTQNINCQDYKLINLEKGTDAKDSVRFDQLTPVIADVENLISGLTNYVQSAQFPNLFNAAAAAGDLFSGTQVNTAIATALAGLPAAEDRLGGVAIHDAILGTLAQAQAAVSGLGLTPMDSGDIEDAVQSGVLVVSPNIAESGLYQLQTNGQLVNLNAALMARNLGYYTEFVVVASNGRRGRQFAVTELNEAANQFQPVEVPYTDEYMGTWPIVVSNMDKSISFNFSANDFVIGNGGEFQLLPAFKQAIAQIPGISQNLTALEEVVQDLNDSLSQQIQGLTADIQALEQTVSGHAQNISEIRTDLGDALFRLATLEQNAIVIADFAKTQEIWFFNTGNGPTIGYVQAQDGQWNPAPAALLEVIAETTSHLEIRIKHDRGVPIQPMYSYTDLNGVRLKSTMFYGIEVIADNSINVLIEKDKRVKLTFPAGVRSGLFA